MKGKLTHKQQLFIKEYLVDLNATQAAIRAGYSPKRADAIGYDLLRNTEIQNKITSAMHNRGQKVEITAARVLQELALIAFADMKNYVSISEDGAVTIKTWDEMPEGASRAVGEVKEVRRIMGSGEGGKEIILECRLVYKHHDKVRALEMVGNHLGMWKNIEEIKFLDVETFELPKLSFATSTKGNGDNGGNGGHID